MNFTVPPPHSHIASSDLSGETATPEIFRTLIGTGGADRLRPAPGQENDDFTILGLGGNDTIWGGLGGDQIYAGLGNDQMFAGAGNDTLDGDSGIDAMFGGAGNDAYRVDDPSDLVFDTDGTSLVWSSTSYTMNSSLVSGSGLVYVGGSAARLTGNQNANYIVGGAGNDVLDGGGGNDLLVGGDGNDTYRNVAGTEGTLWDSNQVQETADGGKDTVIYDASAEIVTIPDNVEFVVLGASVTQVRGSDDPDGTVILGNGADQTAYILVSSDTVIGGRGSDLVVVGSTAVLASLDFIEVATGGRDSIFFTSEEAAALTYVLPDNVEIFVGDDDTMRFHLTGNASDNVILSGADRDILQGMDGNDTLYAAFGNDTQAPSSVTVVDTVTGGIGADTFVLTAWAAATNQPATWVPRLEITDFTHGTDVIELDMSFRPASVTGTALPASMFKLTDSQFTGKDGNDLVLYDETTGKLYIDADQGGSTYAPRLYATLDGAPTLTASDFLFQHFTL